jgi:hypothetical protein
MKEFVNGMSRSGWTAGQTGKGFVVGVATFEEFT